MKKIFTLFVLLMMFVGAKAITVIDAQTDFASKADGNVDIPVWGGGDRLSYKNGLLHFHSEEKTPNAWDVQFFPIASATLKAGGDYTVEFKIKGTGGPIFNMKFGGVDKYGVYTVPVDNDWHVVKVQYKVNDPTNNNGGVLFQCGEYVGDWDMEYMKITHEEAAGAQKVLKITATETKENPWELQAFINLPAMTEGQKYSVRFLAKSTADFDMGTEAIDDKQTVHQDPHGNSAVFNYTAKCEVTTEHKEFTIEFPGIADVECYTDTHEKKHENFQYAATALLLNFGKLPKDETMTISNIRLYDKNDVKVADVELKNVEAYNKSASVYHLGWQNGKTIAIEYDFEPVVIEGINEAITYSSNYNLDFATVTGVEAYMATGVNNSKVTMTKVNGCVPAGTGLVLKQVGENTKVIVPTSLTTTEDVSANKLVATTEPTAVPMGSYVLAGSGDTLGWYSVGEEQQPTLAAGKAYLAFTSSAKALTIDWDTITAIETTNVATAENGAWYTISGIKVASPVKGLYIHNGKKVLVNK